MSDDIKNRLIYAIREGKLETVRELIDSFGVDYSQAWSHGYVLLRDAVEYNYTEITKLLLTKGSKVNNSNKRLSNTPLHFAVGNGNIEIVQMLLDRDAEIGAKNEWGETPLYNAIGQRNMEMTKLLLNRGANVNAPLTSRNYYSISRHVDTPLHFAARIGSEEIVKFLLSSNADVDSKGTNGITSLHIAAEKGYLQIIKILLQHGACVNSACSVTWRERYTPMHFATKNGHTEIVKLLLSSNADVEPKGTNGITPLHVAAENGREEIAKLLLSNNAHVDSNTEGNLTPVYIATEHGHEKVVKLLLDHGANVDAQDKDGRTVLQCAVKNGHCEIVNHILKCCPDVNNKSNKSCLNIAVQSYGEQHKTIVDNLLQFGFTVNPEDVNDYKLLHVAAKKGYFKLVEHLLKSGADVNMLSSNDDTPLHSATENKQEEIVTLLLNFRANVNADDKSGKPPIFYAIQNRDLKIFKLLLTNGANVKDRPDLLSAAVKKKCREIVEIILQHNPDINASDKNGITALHFTVLSKDYFESRFFYFSNEYSNDTEEIARLLLSSGANVNAQTRKGTTALHAAAFRGYTKVVETLLEYNADVNSVRHDITPLHVTALNGNVVISKLLLNKGANLNAKQQDGTTALHIATESVNIEVVEVLLQSGAEVDSRTQRGTTPLHIAAQKGYLETVKILLKFGADIDSTDEYGETALHVASKAQKMLIVKVLLECGSDINIMNKTSNSTPFNLVLDAAIPYSGLSHIFKEHVVKLQTANLYVCDRNLLSINNMGYFKNLCEEEIERMKSEKIIINNNVSFHDILTNNINLVAAYARNESLVQVLKLNDYKIKFPLYASMINCHFKNGVERKKLLEEGFNIIPGLPYNCTEKIFYYLSNKDIKMIIDAYKPSNVSSPSTETSC